MKPEHNRAFKEWAVACDALASGDQILLIRKGGIREEGGTFRIADEEFFLLPTYEHQNARQLQTQYATRLDALTTPPADTVVLRAYAVVDTIVQARDEAHVNALADVMIWNAAYVRQRFDFNPYDPLYLLLLRVYNLPAPITLPMRPAYVGCKSWVTLETALSTAGAAPALSHADFGQRRDALLRRVEAKPF